ncbi:hypothetical protein ACXOUB_07950, partial [Streptococcus thermophilus]
LCTLKKLYNPYSSFTHYRNYRAFLFCYYLGSNKKQVIMFRILKIDDDFVYLSHPDGRLKK